MILSCNRAMLGFLISFQIDEAILERRAVVRKFMSAPHPARSNPGYYSQGEFLAEYYPIWEFLISTPSLARLREYVPPPPAEVHEPVLCFRTKCPDAEVLHGGGSREELLAVQRAIAKHRDATIRDRWKGIPGLHDEELFRAVLPASELVKEEAVREMALANGSWVN